MKCSTAVVGKAGSADAQDGGRIIFKCRQRQSSRRSTAQRYDFASVIDQMKTALNDERRRNCHQILRPA